MHNGHKSRCFEDRHFQMIGTTTMKGDNNDTFVLSFFCSALTLIGVAVWFFNRPPSQNEVENMCAKRLHEQQMDRDAVERLRAAAARQPTRRVVSSQQRQKSKKSSTATNSLSTAYQACHTAFHRHLGGYIFSNQNSAIAIEFYGPDASGIEVQWVKARSRKGAEIFLRGETFETKELSAAVFAALEQHLTRGCRRTGLMDAGCGSMIYDGLFMRV